MRNEVCVSSVLHPLPSIFLPPSSFPHLPSSILRPPLMQGQIRPTCAKRSAAGRPNPTTPSLLGTPSSGPDVNPPSSDLGLSSSSSVLLPPSFVFHPLLGFLHLHSSILTLVLSRPPSSFLHPQSFSRLTPRRRRIACPPPLDFAGWSGYIDLT